MSNKLEHLLSKQGVLTSFSIARRINDENIQKLTEKIKAISKNKADFNKKLRDEIHRQSAESIITGNIPGLIVNGEVKSDTPKSIINNKETSEKLTYNVSKEKLAGLYAFASAFNKEALHNKLTKSDICFIIYTIINFLEIKEEDFKKFHDDLTNNKDNSQDDDNADDNPDYND